MRSHKKIVVAVATGFLALTAESSPDSPNLLYVSGKKTKMSSTDTYWDYVKFQPDSSRLFMARVGDGLTVFDVDKSQLVATIDNSVGANGPLLLPQFDRGYVAMNDGSMLTFALRSLKTLPRVSLNADGLNSGIYDAATRNIHMISAEGPAETIWYSFDAASGRKLGATRFPFRKMDDPATDGKGSIFAPARFDNIILRLDSVTLKETARWSVGCNVSKVRYQQSTGRIIGACVGDAPVMFALDPQRGEVTARIPIGRGLDALVIDDARHRIVTSNGSDGTLSVIAQESPDRYRLLGNVNTTPGARMMDIDQRTGRLYMVNADSTQFLDAETGKRKRHYHPNTFSVQAYLPQ